MSVHPDHSTGSVSTHLRTGNLLQLSPSSLGEIIKKEQCPRYARLEIDSTLHERLFENTQWIPKVSAQVLKNEGDNFESELYGNIANNISMNIDDLEGDSDSEIQTELDNAFDNFTEISCFVQVPLQTEIGNFSVAGLADLVVVLQTTDGPKVIIFDIKASWTESVDQQMQAACYTLALKDQFDLPDNVEVKGGIIYKESLEDAPDLEIVGDDDEFNDGFQTFDVEPRESDIKNLLQTDGPIYSDLVEYETESEDVVDQLLEIPYKIDSKCTGCQYRDACYGTALESLDISLLNIGQGEREALEEEGLETLQDLADLVTKPDYTYKIKPNKTEIAESVRQNHGITKLVELGVRAKLLLEQIDPQEDNPFPRMKNNATAKTMPSDSEWSKDQALQVFLNVQYDYISNSVIGLSAYIYNQHGSETISELISDIPLKTTGIPPLDEEEDEYREVDRVDTDIVWEKENKLLNSFAEDLQESMRSVADEIDVKNPYLHFYTYSQAEQDNLRESLDRHENEWNNGAKTLRHLLAERDLGVGRSGQILWSAIESEYKSLYYQTELPTFLPYVFQQFHTFSEDGLNFTYTKNHQEFNLSQVFDEQFFNFKRDFEYDPVNNSLTLEQGSDFRSFSDYSTQNYWDQISVESYSSAQIPLEYIWGCSKYDLRDHMLPKKSEEDDGESTYMNNFFYVDPNQRTESITSTHITAMTEWICHAMQSIESNMRLQKQTTDLAKIDKKRKSIDVWSDYTSYSLDHFKSAVSDYALMNYSAAIKQTLGEYEKPVEERFNNGSSAPILIADAYKQGGRIILEGQLAHESCELQNAEQLKSAIKYSTGERVSLQNLEVSQGSLNILNFDRSREATPYDMINAPQVKIEEIDGDSVTLSYRTYTFNPVSSEDNLGFAKAGIELPNADNPNQYANVITPPQFVTIDIEESPYITKQKIPALENLEQNPLYKRLNSYITAEDSPTQSSLFEPDKKQTFVDSIMDQGAEGNLDNIFPPKEQHREFITNTETDVLLQGPPGTGKTSSASALGIGACVESYSGDGYENFTGLVTGPSNNSVTEIFESTVNLIEDMDVDVTLYRLMSGSLDPLHEDKEYVVNVSGAGEYEALMEELGQGTLGDDPSVIFGTGFGVKRLFDNHPDDEEGTVYEFPPQVLDMLLLDEASMCTLPTIFMSGAFIKDEAQVFISGDHRQMPPVQPHEWKDETRPSIQKFVPYLSTLNFYRYLRGEEVDTISDENERVFDSPNLEIDFVRLEETYRCHREIAQFLKNQVYSKDSVNYHSHKEYTLQTEMNGTEGTNSVLDHDPMVVITHSENQSQQSNWTEAQIIKSLLPHIPTPTDNSLGVVTPHNSQKGLIRNLVSKKSNVDTVERFQGQSRDSIIVSPAVSDPSYIRAEDDFLLNPNRINVAMSRARKKLIMIVPESVFEHIPIETDTYDESTIWNGLQSTFVSPENEVWNGTLDEFTDNKTNENTEISVYTL